MVHEFSGHSGVAMCGTRIFHFSYLQLPLHEHIASTVGLYLSTCPRCSITLVYDHTEPDATKYSLHLVQCGWPALVGWRFLCV